MAEETSVETGRVLAGVLKLREKKALLKKEYDAQVAVIDQQVEKLEAWLLKQLQASGSDQLKVRGIATAYTQVKQKFSAADWNLVHNYMVEFGRMDLLEKRLSSSALKSIIEETGDLPPGVNMFQELEVVVRKD